MTFDCTQLPGHLQLICEGTHLKATGRPHTPSERLAIVSRYMRLSENEIDLPEVVSAIPIKSEVGTLLHTIIARETGAEIECSECRAEVTKLNLQTPEQVYADRDRIAEGMVERGKRKAPKFWQRWGAKLAPGLAKQQALAWVDEACGVHRITLKFAETSSIVWGVAVNAAPRPVSSLRETLLSVTDQGWSDVLVFAEPGTQSVELPGGCRMIYRPETIAAPVYASDRLGPHGKFGAWQNFVQTLADMLIAFPNANALLYVQDDVQFARNAKSLLERDLWPSQKTGIVSAYCPNYEGYRSEIPKLQRVTQSNLMGALCYAIPRDAAEELLQLPSCQTWKGSVKKQINPPWKRKALDAFAGHAIKELERKVYFYSQSLVEHFSPRGNKIANSAVGNGNNVGFRREYKFVQGDAVGHFPQPWVRWDSSGEQQFAATKPNVSREPVHVVIPGYGLPDVTISCLEALTRSVTPVNVCYIDNGSDTESFEQVQEYIETHFEHCDIVRNTTNRGFTHAVNQGLGLANGRHVLVLNNDCRMAPVALRNMLTHLEWHPKVASVCPTTNDDGVCSLKHLENRVACGTDAATGVETTQNALIRCRVIPRDVLPWFCCLLHKEALRLVPSLPIDKEIASGLAVDDWWSKKLVAMGWMHLQCYDAYAEHDHKTTFNAAGIDRNAEQRKAAKWLAQHG